MTTRALGAVAGIGWLKEAVLMGWRNPGVLLGGAALLLLAMVAVMVPVLIAQLMVQASLGATSVAAVVVSVLTTFAMLAFFAVLLAGYLRLLDSVARGTTVGATGVFSIFRDTRGSMRAIGLIFALAVLQYALIIALVALLAPGFISAYFDLLQMGSLGAIEQQEAASALTGNVWVIFAVIFPVTLFFYAVQAVAIGQVALREGGVLQALVDGITGVAKNLLPLLVLVLASVAGMLVLGLLVALLVAALAFVAQMVGTWLQIALLVLAVPLYLALIVVLYSFSLTLMYLVWRDVCDGSPASEFDADALTA